MRPGAKLIFSFVVLLTWFYASSLGVVHKRWGPEKNRTVKSILKDVGTQQPCIPLEAWLSTA
jgi:hypothetical protein